MGYVYRIGFGLHMALLVSIALVLCYEPLEPLFAVVSVLANVLMCLYILPVSYSTCEWDKLTTITVAGAVVTGLYLLNNINLIVYATMMALYGTYWAWLFLAEVKRGRRGAYVSRK